MTRQFLAKQITRTEQLIEAYNDALDTFALDADIQSYTIDTGQSRQTVSRADISALNAQVDHLLNRLATLQARLSGSGTITARPGW